MNHIAEEWSTQLNANTRSRLLSGDKPDNYRITNLKIIESEWAIEKDCQI